MAKKSFLSGALILMIAGLAVRILGFVYRIYLSNLIGAEGMGLFGLISPVYSLIILTLTSGISIAVSKLVAEEKAKNHDINLLRITRCALAIVLSAGIIVSIFIYIKLDFITKSILNDSRTYLSMLVLIPTIPAIAAASAIKGYFYGTQDVVPTAISQIVEQIVRIGLVMLTASYFIRLGLEYACALATAGMAIGEISNLAVVYIVYLFKRKIWAKNLPLSGLMRKRNIIKNIIFISVPVSMNRFIVSILSAAEYVLIPQMLVLGGMPYKNSISVYGKLTGMAMPLIFFPSLVTSSLATALVPAISEAVSLKNFKWANYRISKSIQITLILGLIFTSIFLSFPNEISDIMYRKQNVGPYLYSLSFTCAFLYLQQTLTGVLNGLGKQGIMLRNFIAASLIRIACVYFLVPDYGINVYVIGIGVSMAFNCITNTYSIIRITGMTLDFGSWIIKPGVVCIIMLLINKYIFSFFNMFSLPNAATTLIAVSFSLFASLVFLAFIGGIEKKELSRLFFHSKQNSRTLLM